MANPYLISKQEAALTLTDEAKNLFRVIYLSQHKIEKESDEQKIRVSDLISKMSFYYEKIRNSVDYKEENLLRKNAIERIIKREIVIQGTLRIAEVQGAEVAKHLLVELIRAGYLPNNTIPESKLEDIGAVIDKYINLKKNSLSNAGSALMAKISGDSDEEMKTRGEIINWILTMAACDIEARLDQNEVAKNIIKDMYGLLTHGIKLPEDSSYGNDLDIQIYIAIFRSYLKFDDSMLSFILFKYFVADWDNADGQLIAETGKKLIGIRKAIEYHLHHDLSKQINRLVNRYTVFYSVLADVLKENPEAVFNEIKKDPKAFPRLIKKVCEKRYVSARSRLWRAAIRSIIYIFVTKSIFVAILEIPATNWFGEKLNPVALGVNIVFPAALLFLAVLFTRLPGDDNTSKIIDGINQIMFQEKRKNQIIELKKPGKRGTVSNTIFGIIYAVTFFVSFGIVVYVLDDVGFTWVSITIFLFFLALVSFFTIRIRRNTKSLIVVEPKENIISLLSDFFYVPIIKVGQWLSEKFSKVNVFVFVLDFIIEAPFKIFVEIAEEWTKYVKERREEIS